MKGPALIVFGGLPGTGKTTLARAVAQDCAATYLRIDTIEQALRASGAIDGDVGPAGYVVAYGLAEENLKLGRIVVADCVNPIAITRNAWRDVAARAAAAIFEIEVICSDIDEHRRRVETRGSDIPGLVPPSWADVLMRTYAPYDLEHTIIDTAGRDVAASLRQLRRAMADRLA